MAVCKVLAVLALITAALGDILDREIYDDTPGDMELMYPEQNYVDMPDISDISEPEPGFRPTTQPKMYSHEYNGNTRRMLLYKMLTALRNYDASPGFLSVPKWIQTGTVLVPPDTFNYSHLKGPLGPMFKRSSNNIIKSLMSSLRPQPKWKIKKGKAGSQICYFKLCSFRPTS